MRYNPMNTGDARHSEHSRFTKTFGNMTQCMPRSYFHHIGEGFGASPFDFDENDEGPRCRPQGHGEPDGPAGFGDRGEASRYMPRGNGGPGGPGRHGMPPRRPNPVFLKRRIEESDLMELIDMAGRMAQRRPQGGPARSQSLILSILAGRDTLSQRELQQMLGIQPGSLSELVSKLEDKGFLVREKAKDRRGNLLHITEEGRKAIPIADGVAEGPSCSALSDQEQDQLAALLRKLLTNWVSTMDTVVPRERHAPIPHRDRPVEL